MEERVGDVRVRRSGGFHRRSSLSGIVRLIFSSLEVEVMCYAFAEP